MSAPRNGDRTPSPLPILFLALGFITILGIGIATVILPALEEVPDPQVPTNGEEKPIISKG